LEAEQRAEAKAKLDAVIEQKATEKIAA